MPTTTKTWNFATDLEGWVSSDAKMAFSSAQGNPAGSALHTNTTKNNTSTVTLQIVDTFTNIFGIPSNSTVNSVTVSYDYRVITWTFATGSTTGAFQVLYGATTVTPIGSITPSAAMGSYTSRSSGTAFTTAGLNSDDTATLRLNSTARTANTNGATVVIAYDNISITVDYTEPLPNSTTTTQFIWDTAQAITNADQYIWRVLTPVDKTLSMVWNQGGTATTFGFVTGAANSMPGRAEPGAIAPPDAPVTSVGIQYNVTTSVDKTVGVVFNTRAAVAATKQAIYNVYSTVTSTEQLVWNVYVSVITTDQHIWNVTGQVTKTVSPVWNTLSSATATADLQWNVFSQASTTTTALVWNILAPVASTNTLRWNVIAQVSSTRQIVFNTLTTVTATDQAIWNVLTRVDSGRQLLFNTLTPITKTNQYIWQVTNPVADTSVSTLWNINEAVTTSVIHYWNNTGPIEASVSPRWNTLSAVPTTRQIVFNTLTTVSTTDQYIWNINQAVGAAQTYYWGISGPVDSTTSIRWNTQQATTVTLSSPFNVITRVDKTLALSYNVLVPATITNQYVWNTYVSAAKTVNALWNVQDWWIVDKTLQSIWNTRVAVTKTNQAIWNTLIRAIQTRQAIWNVTSSPIATVEFRWSVLSGFAAAEINSGDYYHVVMADQPRALWTLAETTGTTIRDVAGWGVNGAVVGSPTLGKRGVVNNSLAAGFTPSDYVTTTVNDVFKRGHEEKAFSLEIWMRAGALVTTQLVFGRDVNNGIVITPTNIEFRMTNSAGVTTKAVYIVPTWDSTYHVVASYDAGTMLLFVNGEQVAYAISDSSFQPTSDTMYIGRFIGTASHAAVYREALTGERAAAHVLAGSRRRV